MRKGIILIIIFIILFLGYNFVYQDHRNIEKEVATFNISSTIISNEFAKHPTKSNLKYLNKTIEISGLISESNLKDLTLDDKVFCQFIDNIEKSFKLNTKLKIKGRCIGYDDLFEIVKLDQSTLNDQK